MKLEEFEEGEEGMESVKLPGLRRRIILHVKDLSDKNMQQEKWVRKGRNDLFWYEIRYSIEILFEEFAHDQNPKDTLGWILRNQEEVTAIQKLMEILDIALFEIGEHKPDSAYLTSSFWDDVVEVAKKAFEVMMEGENLDALQEAENLRRYGLSGKKAQTHRK